MQKIKTRTIVCIERSQTTTARSEFWNFIAFVKKVIFLLFYLQQK